MGRAALIVVLGVALLLGCTPGVPTAAPTSPTPMPAPVPTAIPIPAKPTPAVLRGTVVVEAAEQYFYPEQVTIARGTTILWMDIQGTHDMVADDKTFASAVLVEGGIYSFTFNTPGLYRYICTLHVGAGMWAEIIVE
jgi:plastocyanin